MPKSLPGAILDIDFEWPVCDAGYKLHHPKVKPAPKSRHETLIEREARRDDAPRIKPETKDTRLGRPFAYHETLYGQFANLDGSPESCLEFVGSFGLLGVTQSKGGEPLYEWQRAVKGMDEAIRLSQTDPIALRNRLSIDKLRGTLEPMPPDGRLVFRLRPISLLHGMQIQFVQAISSGLAIKECELCGNWFEAGGDRRRRDAQFCTNEHKINWHNLQKVRKS